MPRLISALGVLLVVSHVTAGCSSGPAIPKAAAVTGEVTYQGKAVEGAEITFSPATEGKDAKPASGKTDAQGKFTLKTYFDPQHELSGALPGDYKVTIIKKEAGAASQAEMLELMKSGKPMPMPKDLLPAKYGNPQQSGLNQTVAASGKNDFKFPLVD